MTSYAATPPKPRKEVAAAYRARRLAEGWQFWQIPAPPEIVAAMAQLRERTGKTEKEIVRDLVAAAVKTGSRGRSRARPAAARPPASA